MKLSRDDVFERYRVEAEVGSGGMATVYRVKHTQLGSTHALKVLDVQHPAIRRRLLAEGRIQASLRHANIVSVTDVIEVNGQPGLVMDFVDGPSLDRWLAERRPTLDDALHIFRGVLAGVARAHQRGVVHRDLKPANVLLEDGDDGLVPRVTDFGLVKFLETDSPELRATRSGLAMGTPAYMAPEQVEDSKKVDRRADVWALGCLLYELVTGRSPFDGPTLLAIFAKLSTGEYPPPESLVPDLPPPVGRAIRAALVHDREHRAADCLQLRAILDGADVVLPSAAVRSPLPPTREVPAAPATAPSWHGGPVAVVSPSSPPAAVVSPQSPSLPVAPLPLPAPQARPELANSRTTFDPDPAATADARPWLLAGGLAGLLLVGALAVIVVLAAVKVASGRSSPPLAEDDRVAALAEPPEAATTEASSPAQPGDGGNPAARATSARHPVDASTPAAGASPTAGANAAAGASPSTGATSAPQVASKPEASEPEAAKTGAPPSTEPRATVPASAATSGAPAPAAPIDTTPAPAAETAVSRAPRDGRVTISGSHYSAQLYGEAGIFSAGTVPAGTYRLRVAFGQDRPFDAGEVVVKVGRTTAIRCDAEMALCKVEAPR